MINAKQTYDLYVDYYKENNKTLLEDVEKQIITAAKEGRDRIHYAVKTRNVIDYLASILKNNGFKIIVYRGLGHNEYILEVSWIGV